MSGLEDGGADVSMAPLFMMAYQLYSFEELRARMATEYGGIRHIRWLRCELMIF
jgi:hypothetical protein